jgi:hypothetical protein
MELDLHVHSCTHCLRHRNSPPSPRPPALGLVYEGAIDQIDDISFTLATPWTFHSDSSMILTLNVAKAIKGRHVKWYYMRSQQPLSSVKIP